PGEEIAVNAGVVAALDLREAYAGDAENAVGLDSGEQISGRGRLATLRARLVVTVDERVGCRSRQAPADARAEAGAVELVQRWIHQREQLPFFERRADHHRHARRRAVSHHLD